jgi:hypothetical protein
MPRHHHALQTPDVKSKQPFNSLIPEARIIAFRFRLLSESGESERGRNRIGKFCKSNHALNLTRLPNERQMSILQCKICTKPKLCSMLMQAAVLWSGLGCRNVQLHENRPILDWTADHFDARNKTGQMRPPSESPYYVSIDPRLPTRVFDLHRLYGHAQSQCRQLPTKEIAQACPPSLQLYVL